MENPEGVLNLLDEFAKLKSKEIPNDLEEYLSYVASSGDPVYQWSLIKSLYRQKLINVITEFYEMYPVVEIPRCPNVDPFNYESMKNSLLKRLDSFSSAPFTIQRISELLTTPRKQYNRVDKFMRAIEKNIWVVSTREPGLRDSNTPQETPASLMNGVTPRVRVTVKHPKGAKTIESRIKSGHPQLIVDEEDEEEVSEEVDEYGQTEENANAKILTNNEADESSLQCTSVKDLIEKYENGTIFSNSDEKPDHLEEIVSTSAKDIQSLASSSSSSSSLSSSSSSFTLTNTATTATEGNVVEPILLTSLATPSIPMLPTCNEASSETSVLSKASVNTIKRITDFEPNKEGLPVYSELEESSSHFVECKKNETAAEFVALEEPTKECNMLYNESEKETLNSTVDVDADKSVGSNLKVATMNLSVSDSASDGNSLQMMVEAVKNSSAADVSVVTNADAKSGFPSFTDSEPNSQWQEKMDAVFKSSETF